FEVLGNELMVVVLLLQLVDVVLQTNANLYHHREAFHHVRFALYVMLLILLLSYSIYMLYFLLLTDLFMVGRYDDVKNNDMVRNH
ncbi:hypothetical protein EX84_15180, partial [Staphylococcus aureus]